MIFRRYLRPILATVLMLVVVGTAGALGVSYCSTRINSITKGTLPAISNLAMANQFRGQAFLHLVRSISSRNAAEIRTHEEEIHRISQLSTEHLQAYGLTIRSEENLRLYHTMMADRQAYIDSREQIIEQIKAGNIDEASRQLDMNLMPMYLRYLDNGQKLVDYASRNGEQQLGEIRVFLVESIVFTLISSVAIFVSGFVMGYTR